MNKSIHELIKISQYAGNRVDYVQGGGGNTSVKDNGVMLIKASGYRLCDISEKQGFVAIKYPYVQDYYQKVDITQQKDFDKESHDILQTAILATEGLPLLRPSVEVGFHALLKKYVIHTHSIYANLLTCCMEGKEIAEQLFSGKDFGYIFLPYFDPGFSLCIEMRDAIDQYIAANGRYPEVIFLQNHGVVVTSDYLDRSLIINTEINDAIREYFNLSDTMRSVKLDKQGDTYISKTAFVEQFCHKTNICKSLFEEYPLYPDQLVYLNNTLTLTPDKMSCEKGKIIYNCSFEEAKTLEESLSAFLFIIDTLKNKGLTFSFMSKKDVDFINSWEAEKYRRSMSK